MSSEVARVENITKEFGGIRALSRVSLAFKSGMVHVIVGENGAGKSTLVKILAGVLRPTEGRVLIRGEPVELTPRSAIERGVAAIYQERALVPKLSIAQNLLLGSEPIQAKIMIDSRIQHKAASEALHQLGLDLDPRRSVESLSVAEQQFVAIAKALQLGAQLLILDEATAAFTPSEVRRLFEVIDDFRRRDIAIIYISHRLDEVRRIADCVSVLKDGVLQATLPAGADETKIIPLMIGRELGDLFPSVPPPLTTDPILRVRNLSASSPGVRNVSFDLYPGEILGVAGLPDSGKSALAACIAGAAHRDNGSEIIVEGKTIDPRSVGEALAHGIGYVPPDRRHQATFGNFSITPSITISALKRFERLGVVRKHMEHNGARDVSVRLRVKGELGDSILSLSGGNQQKCVLARTLCRGARVLVLDDPTAGVDVGARGDLYRILVELAAEGKACLIVSSDMIELLGMCHRILVLREGVTSAEFSRGEATEERILNAQLPLERQEHAVSTRQ